MDKCAFEKGKKCTALTTKKCNGCNFYKTKEQLKEGREKSTDRLMTLSMATLKKIKAKYYRGGSAFKGE